MKALGESSKIGAVPYGALVNVGSKIYTKLHPKINAAHYPDLPSAGEFAKLDSERRSAFARFTSEGTEIKFTELHGLPNDMTVTVYKLNGKTVYDKHYARAMQFVLEGNLTNGEIKVSNM